MTGSNIWVLWNGLFELDAKNPSDNCSLSTKCKNLQISFPNLNPIFKAINSVALYAGLFTVSINPCYFNRLLKRGKASVLVVHLSLYSLSLLLVLQDNIRKRKSHIICHAVVAGEMNAWIALVMSPSWTFKSSVALFLVRSSSSTYSSVAKVSLVVWYDVGR